VGVTKIYLAGLARVVRKDGQRVVLTRKPGAFLAYLALQGRARRSTLADLLWPSVPEPEARGNLRELQCRLNAAAGTPFVVGDSESLHLVPSTWIDVLPDPDGLDGRDLLGAYAYDDCPALAAWLKSERDGLRGLLTIRLLDELGRSFGPVPG
jgi:hypothetical protein